MSTGEGVSRTGSEMSLLARTAPNFFNLTIPPYPYLAWTFHVNDANGKWWLTPLGNAHTSIALFVILAAVPLLSGIISFCTFSHFFYSIRVNTYGTDPRGKRWWKRLACRLRAIRPRTPPFSAPSSPHQGWLSHVSLTEPPPLRRKVLIATLEYEILGWDVKVR